jgi:hypothetical protein
MTENQLLLAISQAFIKHDMPADTHKKLVFGVFWCKDGTMRDGVQVNLSRGNVHIHATLSYLDTQQMSNIIDALVEGLKELIKTK